MEWTQLLRVILAFGFVVALMFAIAWTVRRLGLDRKLAARGMSGGRSLGLEEVFFIDPRHKIVLVRRGKKRHLLLLGQQHSMVLESYEDEADDEHPSHDKNTPGTC